MKAKVTLIIYKIGVKLLNRFFEYTNKVSYEWYLVHILVFSIYFKFARGIMHLCRLVSAHGVVVCGGYWVSLGGEEDKVVMPMLSGFCPHYHYLYSPVGYLF